MQTKNNSKLVDVSSHYEFGKNWKDYSKKIDRQAIDEAEKGLLSLISKQDLEGKSLLDIGSGSGLHSLAALNLGVRSVVAIDIDQNSAETTVNTLKNNSHHSNADVRIVSILDSEARKLGQFDIVYSWGVLHHTGAMWEAIEKASGHVRPGGRFVIAIYRKTPLCWAWKVEKRIFTNGNKLVRSLIRIPYIAAYFIRLGITGTNPFKFVRDYDKYRGMNFYNDIDDWLGGYPYESATETEIISYMKELGFESEYVSKLHPKLGLFGTGCSEFRFRKLI